MTVKTFYRQRNRRSEELGKEGRIQLHAYLNREYEIHHCPTVSLSMRRATYDNGKQR